MLAVVTAARADAIGCGHSTQGDGMPSHREAATDVARLASRLGSLRGRERRDALLDVAAHALFAAALVDSDAAAGLTDRIDAGVALRGASALETPAEAAARRYPWLPVDHEDFHAAARWALETAYRERDRQIREALLEEVKERESHGPLADPGHAICEALRAFAARLGEPRS